MNTVREELGGAPPHSPYPKPRRGRRGKQRRDEVDAELSLPGGVPGPEQDQREADGDDDRSEAVAGGDGLREEDGHADVGLGIGHEGEPGASHPRLSPVFEIGEGELPAVIPVLLWLFEEEGFPVGAGTAARLLSELLAGMEGGYWKILGIDAYEPDAPALAGVVACQQADTLPLGPHLFIRFLYVRPEYRRTRAAFLLLKALAEFLVTAGLSDWLVVGHSRGSLRKSYRKLGMIPLCAGGITTVARAAKKLGIKE